MLSSCALLWGWLIFSAACFVYTAFGLAWMRHAERGWERLSPEKQRAYAAFERCDRGRRWSIPLLVGGFFLLPLRVLVLILLLALHNATYRILAFLFGLRADASPRELHAKRKVFAAASRLFCSTFLRVFGIVRKRNIWWDGRERRGPDAFEVKNIVANHVSCLDIIFFMAQAGTAFVCKASISRAPLIAWPARFLNCIFVDRDSDKDRRAALQQLVQRMRQNCECSTGNPLVVFPEGTTTNGRCLISFRRGAFAALATVQPCVLIYSAGGFHPAYELIPSGFFIALSLAALPFAELTAVWLKPMSPPPASDFATEEERVLAFSKQVREAMWEELRKRHYHPARFAEGESPDSWDGSTARRAECVADIMNGEKATSNAQKKSL